MLLQSCSAISAVFQPVRLWYGSSLSHGRRKKSPVNRKSSNRKQVCPGVWPGVWIIWISSKDWFSKGVRVAQVFICSR